MSLTSPNRGWPLERIEYDSGQLESIHRDVSELIHAAGNARIVLHNIQLGLEGRGESIRRVKSASGALSAGIDPTAARLVRIADVVRVYGDAVTKYGRTANDLIDDIEQAHREAQDAETSLGAAESEHARVEGSGDPTAAVRANASVTDAEGALSDAQNKLDELWGQWEAAYGHWDDAYGDAVAALANVGGRASGPSLGASALAAIDALANADSPAEVSRIWDELTEAQRDSLRRSHPEFIGNLEGVPYLERFLANRAVYDATVTAGPYGEPLDSQLKRLGVELDRFDGQLLAFHPFEQPQATAAVMYGVRITDEHGNRIDPLEGITNVNVLVGGMFSSLEDLKAWGESARNLNDFAEGYGNGVGSATIAWYGYDSPDLLSEHTMGSATEGAATLTQILRGLDTEVSTGVTTSVIGHSYGSTTAFLAVGAAEDNLGVDRLIAVGSAGVPDGYHAGWTEDDPMDYSGTEIFASRSPGDIVARYGEVSSFGHGTDPESLRGAVGFESDGGDVPSLDGGTEVGLGTPGHAAHDGGNSVWGWWEQDNGYLSRDSESFRNIANIVANGEPLG